MHTSDSTPTKPCSKCGTVYPFTAEYFYRDTHARTGLRSDCRFCNKAKSLKFRNEHIDESRARELRYNETHREKRREYQRQLRKNNPGYGETHRDQVKRSAWERAWRDANPHKISIYKRRDSAKRRAYKAQSVGDYTPADLELQFRSQRGKCWHCGKKLKGKHWHADHLTPLSRGGSNAPENIVVSCPNCNLSKGAKLPQEWNGRLL